MVANNFEASLYWHSSKYYIILLFSVKKKDRAIKKRNFFGTFFSNVQKFQRPLRSRGGEGLGLNGLAIKRRTFFAASPTEARSFNFILSIILSLTTGGKKFYKHTGTLRGGVQGGGRHSLPALYPLAPPCRHTIYHLIS